jgi:hypothetical protein
MALNSNTLQTSYFQKHPFLLKHVIKTHISMLIKLFLEFEVFTAVVMGYNGM